MKPSDEWTEDDILSLITNQIKESSYLEYKRCDALRPTHNKGKDRIIQEVSKDVSSFANADGGTIVYGVIDDDHIPIGIDNQPFNPDEITKEWLENIIDSNVKRKIQRIKINQIDLSHRNAGKVIYAVYIPQSSQGAHQANDFRYYQRRNFKVEPMEDYQVRDVMNRFKYPILELKYSYYTKDMKQSKHIYGLELSIVNVGNVTAKNFGIDLYFASNFLEHREDVTGIGGPNIITGMVNINREEFWKISYRNNMLEKVLFPTEKLIIFDRDMMVFTYKVNASNWEKFYHYNKLKYILYADDMVPKEKEISIFSEY